MDVGDSGGPLVMSVGDQSDENPCNDVLLGIVSYGVKCGNKKEDFSTPGIYTRISEYISWIETRGENESTIFTDPDTCIMKERGLEPGECSIQESDQLLLSKQ